MTGRFIRAIEVHSELDEVAANLQWASRVDRDSPSNRNLRILLMRPSVLDLLERLTKDERERIRGAISHSGSGS